HLGWRMTLDGAALLEFRVGGAVGLGTRPRTETPPGPRAPWRTSPPALGMRGRQVGGAVASNQASKSLREIPRARGRTSDDAHSVRSATDELVPWVRAAHCVEQPIG
ncbi:unnamed protein product, partial [Prorocentrum cordatum]